MRFLTCIALASLMFSCSGPDLNGKTFSSSDVMTNLKFGNSDVEYIWFRPGSTMQNTEYGTYSVSGNKVSIKISGRDEWNYEYDSGKLYMLNDNGGRFGSYMSENTL